MSRFKEDVDIPRQVCRRYRRAPHEIELEGGVRLAAAQTHDREGEACRLDWNAGRIVLGVGFSVIRCLPLRSIDRFSGRIKDVYSAKRLLAGKVHIFHRSTCWRRRFGLGALVQADAGDVG